MVIAAVTKYQGKKRKHLLKIAFNERIANTVASFTLTEKGQVVRKPGVRVTHRKKIISEKNCLIMRLTR